MPDLFAVPVLFIAFREALECVIIVSVLLAFLKQTLGGPEGDGKVYRKLARQVWLGVGLGVLTCLVSTVVLGNTGAGPLADAPGLSPRSSPAG